MYKRRLSVEGACGEFCVNSVCRELPERIAAKSMTEWRELLRWLCRDVMGEWKSLGNPAAGGDAMDRAYTFFSQPAFVVPVHGKAGRFVFMADQWDTTNLGASRCAQPAPGQLNAFSTRRAAVALQ